MWKLHVFAFLRKRRHHNRETPTLTTVIMDITISIISCVYICHPYLLMTDGLRIVDLIVPAEVIINTRVRLVCDVDLEGDSLYSLKWYLNNSEILSFMPSRNESTDFLVDNLPVIFDSSNWTDILIDIIFWDVEGIWTCEVFADESFQKDRMSDSLSILAPPTQPPVLLNVRDFYDFHDVVDVTCRSPASKPLPKLSWSINGFPAPPNYVTLNEVGDELNLRFVLDVHHLLNGNPKISLSCSASMSYNASNYQTLRNETLQVTSNSSNETPLMISGMKESYEMGQNLSLRCWFRSRQERHEEIFLTWRINDVDVRPQYVIQYTLPNYSGLEVPLDSIKHLMSRRQQQQLSVKCLGTRVFWKFKDKSQSSSSLKEEGSIFFLFFLSSVSVNLMSCHQSYSSFLS